MCSSKSTKSTNRPFGRTTGDSIYDEIERDVYIKHGINAGSYHDGDLEGNNIRKWMQKARVVMLDMQNLLKEEFADDAGKCAFINARWNLCADALVLFNGFFSRLHTQGSDCTPELLNEAMRFAAADAWNRLGFPGTLKLHGIGAHAQLLERIEASNGRFR